MFTPSDRHQSSRLYATHRMVDQGPYGIIPGQRIMGPPSSTGIPQPIEVDMSRPCPPWASPYPLAPLEDPDPSFPSNSSPSKQLNVHDFGSRRAPDSLETWYTGNDGPWIPKGTVPEATQDDRYHVRGQYTGYRSAVFGPPVGNHHRSADVLDNGNLHYGIPPPSDSGYGTRRSVENTSVRSCEMTQSGIDRNLIDHNLDVRPYGEDDPSSREPLAPNSWTANPVGIEVEAAVPGQCCETCGKEVKTKSEMKKHVLRHTKPYHCEVQQCERTEGYSTANDLERHMISKHPNTFPGGKPPKTYRCMVFQCKSTDKNWPRLDNFRSHLKRIHHFQQDQINSQISSNIAEHRPRIEHSRDESLDQTSETPDNGNKLPGHSKEPHTAVPVGDAVSWTSEKISQCDRSEPAIDPTLEEPYLQQAFESPTKIDPVGINQSQDFEPLDQKALWLSQPQGKIGCLGDSRQISSETLDNTLPPIINETKSSPKSISSEDVGERGKASKRTKSSQADSELREAIAAVLKAKIGQAGGSHHSFHGSHSPQNGQFATPSELTPATALVRPGDIQHVCSPSISMNLATIPDKYTTPPKEDNNIQLTEEVLEAIKKAGFVLRREFKPSGSSGGDCSSAVSNNKKSENIKQCTMCTKFSGRPCELKKHMKRHERPYGCTFPKCRKAFGSKNDWKRHETTQHDQSELWRCDEPGCSKVFHQLTLFNTHLTDVHNITEHSIIERKIDSQRIGSNHQAHFWCGFCKGIINLNQKGVDAWTERFNHIDDHFMGRNGNKGQSILEWLHANGDSEGVQISVIEDCSENSTSSGSSNSSSDSSPKSESPPTEVVSMPLKRRRDSNSYETKQSPPKKNRINKDIICCQCDVQYSPKVYASCLDCEHEWCGSCNKINAMEGRDDFL